MDSIVGIVGPVDFVGTAARTCRQQPHVIIREFPYSDLGEVRGIVQRHEGEVDAWLFTGIVPYSMTEDLATRPSIYVDYTGATFLQALVRLLLNGERVTDITIDTLPEADVRAAYEECGISTDGLKVLPFRPDLTVPAIEDFHRRHHSEGGIVITCIATVDADLSKEFTTFRLTPSAHSIRTALSNLRLASANQINEESQVALALIELGGGDADRAAKQIASEAASLVGTSTTTADGLGLIVTTRGPISMATGAFSSAPFLGRIGCGFENARIGIGVGYSALEAERLARRGLTLARRHGSRAAVACFRNELDILLGGPEATNPSSSREAPAMSVAAARAGLSVQTLQRVKDAARDADDDTLNARELAGHLGIQARTARKVLQRLELAGLAARSGNLASGASGRPLTKYRVYL